MQDQTLKASVKAMEDFAKRIIGETWTNTGDLDCKAYQREYLYRSAFGAYHTATSYWILHENKRFSDCNILARNLLERVFNSSVASKSPTVAVELICHELKDKIRRFQSLSNGINASAQNNRSIEDHEKILQTFLSLIKATEVPDWNFYRRAEESGLDSFYRSGYFDFSRYAHAGYEVPRPEKYNQQLKASDFIALIAPILTAQSYHALDCPNCHQGKCAVADESKALSHDFSRCTLRNAECQAGVNP